MKKKNKNNEEKINNNEVQNETKKVKNDYYDVEKLKGVFKSIAAFTVVVMAFIFCEYYFISLDNFNDEAIRKRILNEINIDVGETINLSNYVSNVDNIKYVSFKKDTIYSIDENYNVISLTDGEDEMKILYRDHSTSTLYLKTNVDTSNASLNNQKLKKAEITLNNMDATNIGATKIYVTYFYNTDTSEYSSLQYYLDSKFTKQMTTSFNKINVPTKDGYTFRGYYTEKDGKGLRVINEKGYLVPNVSFTNKRIYAYFN